MPANVALDLSTNEPSEVGEPVTATVSVTDAAGNAVADGTAVKIEAKDLRGDYDSVLSGIVTAPATKGGETAAEFVTVGDGRAVVTAVVTTDIGTVVRAVEVVDSSAGAPEPAPEPEPVDCSAVGTGGLSATSGFATWSHDDCGTSASALFESLSARGASALHLWNGSAWVRYSVVDGAEVPGSSNFSVENRDILYISN